MSNIVESLDHEGQNVYLKEKLEGKNIRIDVTCALDFHEVVASPCSAEWLRKKLERLEELENEQRRSE